MDKFNIQIPTTKNLLAFSAGVDSTALFYILVERKIAFDIAIVDYAQRMQSKDEVIYATQLAHKYGKKCFISEYPSDVKFSEKEARDFRYQFFDTIIIQNSYEALITAHQLNDKLEWFLMQLTKGAGLNELLGFQKESFKNSYTLYKPLLEYTKESLKQYLHTHHIKYFEDETNQDEKYKRNYFRHQFSDKLLETYEKGICNSFEYLQKDFDSLFQNFKVKKIKQLHIYEFPQDLNIAIRIIDKDLKQRGVMITKATREEIIAKKEVVISHKISVAITKQRIYIAPYLQVTMMKKFKERCRKEKIPKNIRGYLFTIEDEDFLQTTF